MAITRAESLEAVDTNVLARWVLGDDPVQTPLAAAILAQPFHVPVTVLLELGWVLDKAIGLPRAVVAGMLAQVIELDTAVLDNADLMVWAITRYRAGADWADMVHLAQTSGNASAFASFDRKLPRGAGSGSPLPIRILGTAP